MSTKYVFAFHASRKAISHWGIKEYGYLFAFWLLLTIVPYVDGWGLLSLLLFPILLICTFVVVYVVYLIILFVSAIVNRTDSNAKSQPILPKEHFPLEIVIPQLGIFKLSPMFREIYENKIDWCGNSVNLGLHTEGCETIEVLEKLTIQLVENQNTINSQVLAFLIGELLPAINENPTGALEKELTAEEFIETITLEDIEIYPAGSYTFWFDDGYLLGGHAIQVNGNIITGESPLIL